MKHLIPFVALAGLCAWQLQDPVLTTPAGNKWEYRVVGLTELHASTLDYIKGIVGPDGEVGAEEEEPEGRLERLLGLGKKVDDQLVARTQDMLNGLGADGWELADYRNNVVILKRPLP